MDLIGRRRFLVVTTALCAAPVVGTAQPKARVSKVGYIGLGMPSDDVKGRAAFRAGLIELGHVEGQTVTIEARWAGRKFERLPMLAKDLVQRSRVDVMYTAGCDKSIIEAVRSVSRSVPLVIGFCGDVPGFHGEVASLAHPGGRTTGQTFFAPELSAKRLGLLKELVPRLSTVLVLWNPAAAGPAGWEPYWRELRVASALLGIELKSLEVRNASELESELGRIEPDPSTALVTLWDPVVFFNRRRIFEIALERRLVAGYDFLTFADEGGLLAYAPDFYAMLRRASVLVDKIFKGADPGSIPIERPTEFQLAINLKTAKAIGLTIPQSILLRADRVIE